MTATLVSNARILEAMVATPEYKEFALKFQAQAREALATGVFEVKALGVSLSLPQVAITYQAYKGVPNSLGENARAFAKSISSECLAILKENGYNAGWEGIKTLASHA
jgi:hypothetical protein